MTGHALPRLAADRRAGLVRGIVSVCSAHPTVLAAALAHGRRIGAEVLIEATCNQVNQDGGYTGMDAAGFRDSVRRLADAEGLAAKKLILGGDHLGPNPWRHLPAEAAMAKAETMVAAFAAAGFRKLHLDASMGCAGEPEALDDRTTAQRAARLAYAAEAAAAAAGLPAPLYVIGTEVPTPGGATHGLDHVAPTTPEAARRSLEVHRHVFWTAGLGGVMHRVIALVVQPGVEFGHTEVLAYDRAAAAPLRRVLDQQPDLVFEAHSSDYQPPAALADLVADGFCILKVGPALTFAWREALYGLGAIASELNPDYPPDAVADAMERLMLAEPAYWRSHYAGDADTRRRLRHHSLSDRIRYYWSRPDAQDAVARLLAILGDYPIPREQVVRFLPSLAESAASDAPGLLRAAIDAVLSQYSRACRLL